MHFALPAASEDIARTHSIESPYQPYSIPFSVEEKEFSPLLAVTLDVLPVAAEVQVGDLVIKQNVRKVGSAASQDHYDFCLTYSPPLTPSSDSINPRTFQGVS